MQSLEETSIQGFLLEKWKGSVLNAGFWTSCAKTNEYIADLLYKKYRGAHQTFEEKLATFRSSEISDEDLQRMQFSKQIVLFYGSSFECYLKALLVFRGKIQIIENVKDGVRFTKQFATHDLNHLFLVAFDREPSEKDREQIQKLERGIRSGRYPFELRPDTALRAYTGGLDTLRDFFKEHVKIVLEELKES